MLFFNILFSTRHCCPSIHLIIEACQFFDDDRYCIDIMTQLRAVKAALSKVETELMRENIDHCVASAMSSGDPQEQRRKADELITLLQRSMR